MRQLLVILLVALVTLMSTEAKISRRPRRYFSSSSSSESYDNRGPRERRGAARVPSTSSLSNDLRNSFTLAQNEVSSAITTDAKQAVVVKYRSEFFSLYDKFLKESCSKAKDFNAKKDFAREAWENVSEYLNKLEKLNFHNGCLINSNQFGTVIYA